MQNLNNVAVAETVLGTAVADDGTFTVSYPTGTNQSDFAAGMAGTDSYVILNSNDRWDVADPGFALSFGASNITVTNQTGAALAAGTEVTINLDMAEDDGQVMLPFRVDLASITGAQDVVTDFQPGFEGEIVDAFFVVDKPVTTAAKLASLNVEIGSTNLTGGVVALTSAAATPMGKVVSGSAITGANSFNRDDKISVEASSVTAFAEGSGTLWLRCRKAA